MMFNKLPTEKLTTEQVIDKMNNLASNPDDLKQLLSGMSLEKAKLENLAELDNLKAEESLKAKFHGMEFMEMSATRRVDRNAPSDMVKVGFSMVKGSRTYARLYIGHDVLKKLQIETNGIIKVMISKDDPQIWMIQKSQKSNASTYKLATYPASPRFSVAQYRWTLSDIGKLKTAIVEHQIIDEKLYIINTFNERKVLNT